jgi:hypothetical protein
MNSGRYSASKSTSFLSNVHLRMFLPPPGPTAPYEGLRQVLAVLGAEGTGAKRTTERTGPKGDAQSFRLRIKRGEFDIGKRKRASNRGRLLAPG